MVEKGCSGVDARGNAVPEYLCLLLGVGLGLRTSDGFCGTRADYSWTKIASRRMSLELMASFSMRSETSIEVGEPEADPKHQQASGLKMRIPR